MELQLQKFQGLINRLRKELAKLYLAKEHSMDLAQRAMLSLEEITFDNKATDNWGSIIMQAVHEHKLEELLRIALGEHPESSVLMEASNIVFQQTISDPGPVSSDQKEGLRQLLEYLRASYIGFQAQAHNRNQLFEKMKRRLNIKENFQYEDFFSHYYDDMNRWEKRQHGIIRKYTDIMKINNERSLETIKKWPSLKDAIPLIEGLKDHLVLWLDKYHHIFLDDQTMCLVYVGITEKKPFPRGIENEIEVYLKT